MDHQLMRTKGTQRDNWCSETIVWVGQSCRPQSLLRYHTGLDRQKVKGHNSNEGWLWCKGCAEASQ